MDRRVVASASARVNVNDHQGPSVAVRDPLGVRELSGQEDTTLAIGYAPPAMLTPHVRLDGFDTQDWLALQAMFNAPSGSESGSNGGGIVAISLRNRLRKLLHTRDGAQAIDTHPWPMTAADLASRHGARWGLVLEQGVLETLMDRTALQLRPNDDLLDQVLTAWRVLRALAREDRFDLWPGSLRTVPVPARELITRALDLFVPDNRTVVIASWRGSHMVTCLAMRRTAGAFDTLLGPNELRAQVPPSSGDRAAAHRRLIDAVQLRLGAVSLGLSADQAVWGTLFDADEPGRWARLVASGNVLIDPMPAAVALPLAVDAGRIAYLTLRSAVRRFTPARREGSGGVEGLPDFELLTMLRLWAGLGAALGGRHPVR